MYILVFICIYIIYICIYVYLYMYILILILVYTYIYMCIYLNLYIYIYRRRPGGAEEKMYAWTSGRSCRAYAHSSVVPVRYVPRQFGPEGLAKVLCALFFIFYFCVWAVWA